MATPEFAPESADGQVPFYVTVTCSTAGATTRYTVNGTDPTEASIPVPVDGKVRIASNITLKARAFKAGMTQSAVKSATYRVTGAITGGGAHVLALTPGGNLYGWGPQSSGRLGNGSTSSTDALNPSTVLKTGGGALTGVVDMSGGYLFSLAVTADGKVWATGDNANGQLGSNSVTDASVMQRVLKNAVTYGSAVETDFLSGISGASGGYDFSTAVASDGKVWSWGQRARGRLGDSYVSTTAAQRRYADTVKTGVGVELTNAVQVRSGRGHTVALVGPLDSHGRGQLWAWGRNVEGQLGQGTTTDSGYALRVKRDATATTYPTGNWMDKVVDFAVGYDHVVAIRQDDAGARTVWCWGEQQNGRLGNGVGTAQAISYPDQVETSAGVPLTNIIQVAAAGRFTLALHADGSVYAWGYNADGQIGDGTTTNRLYAQKVKKSAGTTPADYLSDVVYIGAGGHDVATPFPGFALAITSTGTFYGWGQNDRGQTGGGSSTPANRVYATQTTFTTKFNNLTPSVSLSVSPATAVEPASFNLSATASDTEGTIAKVEFYENGALLGEDTGSPFTWSVTNRTAGGYTYTAVATDNQGAAAEHSQAATVALPPNVPPSVSLGVSPGLGVEPANFSLTATASDTDGTITKVQFYENDVLLGEDTVTPFTWSVTNRTLGSYTYKAVATDNRAGTAEDSETASVVLPTVQPPTAYPEAGGEVVVDQVMLSSAAGATIFYTTDGSAPDNTSNPARKSVPTNTVVRLRDATTSGDVTLKHYATKSGMVDSPVQTGVYAGTMQISQGTRAIHSLLMHQGKVWSWGDNKLGQLGLGHLVTRDEPVRIPGLTTARRISHSANASLALLADGSVVEWGDNVSGDRKSPVPVVALTSITAVAVGDIHSMALKSDGTVWTWGTNSSGQLGVGGSVFQRFVPQAIGLTDVIAISAGGTHSLALKSDGSVWAWGDGALGQLGNGSFAGSNLPVQVSGLSNIVAISAGDDSSMALAKDGSVWAWGSNSSWQVRAATGSNTNVPLVIPGISSCVAIAAGGVHAAAIQSDGKVICWGANFAAQCAAPIASAVGKTEAASISSAHGVSAGRIQSMALTSSGTVWVWGDNAFGQLGDGNLPVDRSTPFSLTFSFADSDNDDLPDQWEMTYYGNLSHGAAGHDDGDSLSNLQDYLAGSSPLLSDSDNDGFTDAEEVVTGNDPAKSTNQPQRISIEWVADANEDGVQPVSGYLSIKRTGTLTSWFQVNYTVSGTADGGLLQNAATGADYEEIPSNAIFTWDGFNEVIIPIKPFVDVRPEGDETVVVTLEPIGVGGITYYLDPAKTTATVTITDVPPLNAPVFYPTPGGPVAADVVQIRAEEGTTIHYTTDGSFPTTSSPSVPPNSLVRVPNGAYVSAFAVKAGYLQSDITYGNWPGTMRIAAGQHHSLFRDADNKFWAWGRNGDGQLGTTFSPTHSPIEIGSGNTYQNFDGGGGNAGSHSVAVDAGGTVLTWGSNSHSQLGVTAIASRSTIAAATGFTGTATAASAGGFHTVILKNDGTVWSFGANLDGQLGNGTTSSPSATAVQATGLTGIVSVAAGRNHSVALHGTGTVYSWGDNSVDQMGNPSVSGDQSTPVQVPGLTDIVAICAHENVSLALRRDGLVFGWGLNSPNQQARGASGTNPKPPVAIAGVSDAIAISMGSIHAAALRTDGSVITWGSDSDGATANPSGTSVYPATTVGGLSNVLAIATGRHSLALTESGEVWSWGANDFGQLGKGNTLATNPFGPIFSKDSDKDGLLDTLEIAIGSSVTDADSNDDGISDGDAYRLSGYVGDIDANNDGVLDSGVFTLDYSFITNLDLDGDGVNNAQELLNGTSPFHADTDADGVADNTDVFPLDPTQSTTPTGQTTGPVITITFPAAGITLVP